MLLRIRTAGASARTPIERLQLGMSLTCHDFLAHVVLSHFVSATLLQQKKVFMSCRHLSLQRRLRYTTCPWRRIGQVTQPSCSRAAQLHHSTLLALNLGLKGVRTGSARVEAPRCMNARQSANRVMRAMELHTLTHLVVCWLGGSIMMITALHCT